MKISEAAAAIRDDSRETSGQFGIQAHTDPGVVQIEAPPLSIPDTFR